MSACASYNPKKPERRDEKVAACRKCRWPLDPRDDPERPRCYVDFASDQTHICRKKEAPPDLKAALEHMGRSFGFKHEVKYDIAVDEKGRFRFAGLRQACSNPGCSKCTCGRYAPKMQDLEAVDKLLELAYGASWEPGQRPTTTDQWEAAGNFYPYARCALHRGMTGKQVPFCGACAHAVNKVNA